MEDMKKQPFRSPKMPHKEEAKRKDPAFNLDAAKEFGFRIQKVRSAKKK